MTSCVVGYQNHKIHADNRTQPKASDLVLLIQHIPHVGCRDGPNEARAENLRST